MQLSPSSDSGLSKIPFLDADEFTIGCADRLVAEPYHSALSDLSEPDFLNVNLDLICVGPGKVAPDNDAR